MCTHLLGGRLCVSGWRVLHLFGFVARNPSNPRLTTVAPPKPVCGSVTHAAAMIGVPVQTFRQGVLPFVRHYKVRHPRSKRGIILVDLEDLRNHIAKFAVAPKTLSSETDNPNLSPR